MKTGFKSRNQFGFTIIELMVTIAVAGVLLTIAVPAFNGLQARSALRSTAADFITAVNTARVQAVSLRTTVTLKPKSGTDWKSGWVIEYPASVTTEENQEFLPKGTSKIESDDGLSKIEFRNNGLTNAGLAKFSLCDDRTGEEGRAITVSPFGKITNEVKSCS
ncbi:GspH/FimT family pseudopilin [Alcanivorax sp.]|uniref:GspH/FimT family pseudopilin n=1 Tax=Alcanivorax sp. TaxID=1872427 RepID=UPI000C102F13|nr:GspH/FimT family pseudopilin [Alcanivorax sp.]PHR67088.1 MAG: general secretion pathway protein GspH [Alcanivorax sp.]